MSSILAIDGGGSGSRALLRRPRLPDLCIEDGPANAYTDPEGAADRITKIAESLWRQAGIEPGAVVAGIAGCRLPEIAEGLTRRLPFPAYITDDSVTTALGALGGDGTVISLGTGAFALRIDQGHVRHISGWGFTLGDTASGAWFGRNALSAALRAADGLTPHDGLTEALMSAGHPLLQYQNAIPSDFAALAPQVFEHASTPTAQRLIAAAVAEIELQITTLRAPTSARLVLMGGLAPRLIAHLPPALQGRLSEPRGSALDGAIALATRAQ
ncbi:MAG: BadF/BadG/BcrA/BcrD ATPase family protein [Pseudomonadota bacterium]